MLRLAVDVGPVIDAEARDAIEGHIRGMRDAGLRVFQCARIEDQDIERGTYVLPTLIELDSLDQLTREVFGPVVSVTRFSEVEQAVAWANDSDYGLAAAIFSRNVERACDIARRIEETMEYPGQIKVTVVRETRVVEYAK